MDTAQTIQKIKSEYDRAVSRDEKIAKIEASAKTALEKWEAASKIAERTGMATSQVLISNLLDLYPDGNIPEEAAKAFVRPALEHNHKYISEKAVDAQTVMNAEAEVGLSPLAPDFDTRQADAVAQKLTGYDDISVHQKDIEKQIVTASRKTVDDTMRVNAEAHTNVGMNVTVTRIYDGIGVHNRKDRCQWCLSRCGNDMPYREAYSGGAFERHPGCGCEIFYKTGKRVQRQTGWENNTWKDAQNPETLEYRRQYAAGEDKITPLERIRNSQQGYYRDNSRMFPNRDATEPMTKAHIKSVMEEMGVNYGKAHIILARDKNLAGKGLFGYTSPDGKSVTFYPDAFITREELVKTIGHEKIHLDQIKRSGHADNTNIGIAYEREAFMSEEKWWHDYQEKQRRD